jgi:hypothetical protein
VLADTFVLARDIDQNYRFRIAGTRVCAAFGRELKGDDFASLWSPQADYAMRYLLSVVAQETVGFVASTTGRTPSGDELEFELLVLPLKHRGRTDARLLGALVPVSIPYWFGVSTIGRLTLGPLRYLQRGSEDIREVRVPAPRIPSRAYVRHGFLVYDGGHP